MGPGVGARDQQGNGNPSGGLNVCWVHTMHWMGIEMCTHLVDITAASSGSDGGDVWEGGCFSVGGVGVCMCMWVWVGGLVGWGGGQSSLF